MTSSAIELLPFHCPFAAAVNPRLAEIEKLCVDWIDEFRLYQDDAQRERLIATKAAEVYARALPNAAPERVADVAKWLYWGFATDDMVYDNGPVSVRAADFLPLIVQLARIADEPRSRFGFEIPYTDALRDLTVAITAPATPGQRIEWRSTARAWFFGMSWDVAYAERGEIPSLNDYLMMRMHTGGLASWAATLGIADGFELSARDADSPAVRALLESWSTFALIINDLMSYAKEIENKDTSSNIITVIARELSCSPQEAVPHAYSILDRISGLFLRLRADLLPGADQNLRALIAGMEHTWRAILDWGFTSARYTRRDPGSEPYQVFPGWAEQPHDTSPDPLPYPAIAWWWEQVAG
ncbi:terpene synthase family protein [Kitasatospora viridis]|uniref:Terpene synthase n=1 Tax=Kitasatospora viridis TaxID=281105 RepID=A0A561SAF2_9ACTN|nr:hypothetical protein [Kitasatospora viridis]TWF71863.1 hypothetical protein FHX73_1760 [Kitasatospora viridis]